ncbi:MAG: galactonate dehydratase [Clostridiaceae bacterium]|nr:galactonate dehydratase [Clostridiaceae bacterium]
MKLVHYELFKVPPRWLFLRLETDDGFVGWGEPVVEGRADTVAACVTELWSYLEGRDPRRIEDIWQSIYRGGFYRGGPVLTSALSGIEQALWDIKGKLYGVPVYELLGGRCRDRMQVYNWIGGDRPDDVAEAVRKQLASGFKAVKMNATEELHYIDSHVKIDAVLARVAAVREVGGPGLGIGIDFHGRVHKAMAKVLARELEPYRPMFIEEPVLSENLEALRDIAALCSIPIATGERLFTRWDFKTLLQEGYVDIIQPDVSHAGGILECRKIAAMAEAYDVALAPHCPLGPIALAACLQLDACSPNAVIQEQSLGIHYNVGNDVLDYLADPGVFAYADGYVALPDKPGLGIEIAEEKVRELARIGHSWKNPVWRQADGSVAEW